VSETFLYDERDVPFYDKKYLSRLLNILISLFVYLFNPYIVFQMKRIVSYQYLLNIKPENLNKHFD
jgi:hypothetical protein